MEKVLREYERRFEANTQPDQEVIEWWHMKFWTDLYPGQPNACRRWLAPTVVAVLLFVMWLDATRIVY